MKPGEGRPLQSGEQPGKHRIRRRLEGPAPVDEKKTDNAKQRQLEISKLFFVTTAYKFSDSSSLRARVNQHTELLNILTILTLINDTNSSFTQQYKINY